MKIDFESVNWWDDGVVHGLSMAWDILARHGTVQAARDDLQQFMQQIKLDQNIARHRRNTWNTKATL